MDVEFFDLARLCTFTQSTELLTRDHSDGICICERFSFYQTDGDGGKTLFLRTVTVEKFLC